MPLPRGGKVDEPDSSYRIAQDIPAVEIAMGETTCSRYMRIRFKLCHEAAKHVLDGLHAELGEGVDVLRAPPDLLRVDRGEELGADPVHLGRAGGGEGQAVHGLKSIARG